MLAGLPPERWQTLTWRAQDDVVLRQQGVAVRAPWATGGAPGSTSQPRVAPGPAGWRRGERPGPGERGEGQGAFSNLPPDPPLPRLVALAPRRWPIAPLYEEATGEGGLAPYQGRRWDGLPRHLALGMLA